MKRNLSLLIPPVIIMIVIFSSSAQTYEEQTITPWFSSLDQSQFLKQALSWIKFSYGGHEVSIATLGASHFIEFFIRKGAHLSVYFLLAYFTIRACSNMINRGRWTIIWSSLFVVLYAVSDEFHQGFTGGRTPLLTDVIIDSIGGLIGIICYLLFHQRIKNLLKRLTNRTKRNGVKNIS